MVDHPSPRCRCPRWDGTYPTPVAGKCTASAPTGAALSKTGAVAATPGVRILPDGRPIKPAGAEWAFDEAKESGGETSSIVAVPGTSFVVTVDTGDDDHAVRVVDTSKISAGSPVTGFVDFPAPSFLNTGVGVLASGRIYVATGYGVVQALDIDLATGALTRNDADTLMLPMGSNGLAWYSSGVAVSPDGKHLVVTPVFDTTAFVFDVDPTSPTYKMQLGQVDLGDKEIVRRLRSTRTTRPARHAYVSMWAGHKVVEVDVSDPTAPKVSRSFATDKDPQGLAFLDARWMAVGNDFGETLSLVDRTERHRHRGPGRLRARASRASSPPAWPGTSPHGLLYATLAGVNALAAYSVDLTATPPTLVPAGRAADPVVAERRRRQRRRLAHRHQHCAGTPSGRSRMHGWRRRLHPDEGQRRADPRAQRGRPRRRRGAGAATRRRRARSPATRRSRARRARTTSPSPRPTRPAPRRVIEHVFFVVRENKTFDGLLGDFAGVEGDATPHHEAPAPRWTGIWTNLRKLARTFTFSDNYYTAACHLDAGPPLDHLRPRDRLLRAHLGRQPAPASRSAASPTRAARRRARSSTGSRTTTSPTTSSARSWASR